MVSTVFKKEELALILNLPTGESSDSTSNSNKSFQIEVTKNEIALNGKKLSIDEMSEQLKSTENVCLASVILRIDQLVEYKKVVKVIDILKKHKLENLNLITEKNKAKGSLPLYKYPSSLYSYFQAEISPHARDLLT